MELSGYLSVLPYCLDQHDEESPVVACSFAARELGIFLFDRPVEPAFYILRTDLGGTSGSAFLEAVYDPSNLQIWRFRIVNGAGIDVYGDEASTLRQTHPILMLEGDALVNQRPCFCGDPRVLAP